jgi:hypothetical protein
MYSSSIPTGKQAGAQAACMQGCTYLQYQDLDAVYSFLQQHLHCFDVAIQSYGWTTCHV